MKLRLTLVAAACALATAPFALAEPQTGPKPGEKLDHYILQQSGPLGPGTALGAPPVIVNQKIYPLTEGRPLSGASRRDLERAGRVSVEEARGESTAPVSYSRQCVTRRAAGDSCSCRSAPAAFGTAIVNPAGGRNLCAVP